ncbi:hypothetical protein [Desmospora profundinema]|uniref:Transcription elongation factor 1 homolog n=1 Tax=Desmospora profundinema TaxID=1571184 RepID=A0ABU1ISS7_9BACL|nr:hypothetical protein [Desmospora profundinema]MDR6226825.1 hypothetical protein [Desmospora profundinema]
MSRNEWYKLIGEIHDNLPDVPSLQCPHCGQKKVDFQYMGDPKTRIGFLVIWCNACLHGIHISRAIAPEQAKMLSFDDKEEFKKRVPDFTQII